MKEASAASAISTLRIGTSAAISAETHGVSSGALRRRTVIRAAVASCELTTLARLPSAEAPNRRRRVTVPPAAATDACHASLRETSATICRRAASSRSQTGAEPSAAANSSRRPASAQASTSATATAPKTVKATLRRVALIASPAACAAQRRERPA